MASRAKNATTTGSIFSFLFCLAFMLSGCAQPLLEDKPAFDPDTLFVLSSKADQAYSESRWLDAARAYQQLTVWVPLDPYTWFRLGNVYARQGLFEEATKAYQVSIKHSPAQPKPWYNLATTYLLNAQHALRQSYAKLRPGDPARQLIEHQLIALDGVIYQRFENQSRHGQ